MSYLTDSNIYQYQYSDGDDVTYTEVNAHLGDEHDDDTPVVFLRLTARNGAFAATVRSQRQATATDPAAVTAWAVASDTPPSHVAPQAIEAHEHWSVAPSALIQGF